MTDFGFTNSIT